MGISWSEKTRKEYRMALPADGKQVDQFEIMVQIAASGLAPLTDRAYDDFYHYDVEKTESGNTLVIWFYVSNTFAAVRTEERNERLPWNDDEPHRSDSFGGNRADGHP